MSEESSLDRLILQFGNLRVTVEAVNPEEASQGIRVQAAGSLARERTLVFWGTDL